MKTTKRLISAVMAAVIGISCFGFTAFAANPVTKTVEIIKAPTKTSFYKGSDWKYGYWDFPEGCTTGNFVSKDNVICFMHNGGKYSQYSDVGMIDCNGLIVKVTYSDGSVKEIAYKETISGNKVSTNMLISPAGGAYKTGKNTIEVYFSDNYKAYDSFDVSIGNLYGDTNLDNLINSSDALLILKHVVESSKLSGTALENADVNSDGKINSGDALCVLKIAVGIK